MGRQASMFFLLVVILSMVFTGLVGCSSAVATAPEVGKTAPDFDYPDTDGKTVSLSDLTGKVVVINFWATWCGPCRQEMPILDTLAKDEEKAAQGLVLLIINIGETYDVVQTYMESYGYSFPVIIDTTSTIASKYNIRYIPTTFFIDRGGIIRNIKPGAFSSPGELAIILNTVME